MGQPIRPTLPTTPATPTARLTPPLSTFVPEGGPIPEMPRASLRLVNDTGAPTPEPKPISPDTTTHTTTETGPDDSTILYKFERRTSPRELIIGEAIAAFVTGEEIDHAVVAPAQLVDVSASAGGTGVAGLGVRTSVRIPVGSEFSLFPSDQLPRQTGMVVRCEEDPELPGNYRLGLRCRPRLNAA
ncbi:MAG: hypothetical protein SFY95_05925 [Planctomycetota bacterium]|nr:hypothetical protein [Planctomycetota bacterium]